MRLFFLLLFPIALLAQETSFSAVSVPEGPVEYVELRDTTMVIYTEGDKVKWRFGYCVQVDSVYVQGDCELLSPWFVREEFYDKKWRKVDPVFIIGDMFLRWVEPLGDELEQEELK